jgi:pyruvate formate lyase activating enzyme
MLIGGLQKVTLIDYPGKLACTVFLSGCNFRCPFCYSKELVLPEEIKKQIHPHTKEAQLKNYAKRSASYGVGAGISEKEFLSFLKKRKKFLEGIVICGGEPTIHKDLPDFIKKIKKLGYLVKLDTNGSNPKMLKDLIDKKLIDYVAMDIKAPKEKYNKATGVKVDIKKIQKSIDILKKGGIDYEFRSTIVPTIHIKEDVIEMAKWISQPTHLRPAFAKASANKQGFGGQGRYYLQNFRPEKTIDPKFEKIKPYPPEFLLEIQKTIAPFFEICRVR